MASQVLKSIATEFIVWTDVIWMESSLKVLASTGFENLFLNCVLVKLLEITPLDNLYTFKITQKRWDGTDYLLNTAYIYYQHNYCYLGDIESMPILQRRLKVRRVLNTVMSQYEFLPAYSQVLTFSWYSSLDL